MRPFSLFLVKEKGVLEFQISMENSTPYLIIQFDIWNSKTPFPFTKNKEKGLISFYLF